ncbi:alpha/beta fold hydrolase [Curvibacter sp. RS43]|uniref:Alpha/beta fold hydrolase n=1 Tax=Curvibacter microcysteis TaxID=3026419 RepID=A0ABT5MDI3_9BURK|nr:MULTISPECIES: alpha/beta fold hydrolase [unclassified Curvibacter]MDD0811082.1 alpha/beta fold hydrolase [Curvibacter sp. RS43]MDD0813947.1 alpha/beta fold hydrolase [Curvibacter sp. HBC28]
MVSLHEAPTWRPSDTATPQGKPMAVVLLHGLCSTPDELLSVNGPLRQLGCEVVPLRIEGYSFAADQPHAAARPFEDWVAAVHRCIADLRRRHPRVVLVGISAGSGLALASALDPAHPVDGLVLMSTTLRYDGWAIPPWHFLLPLALYTPIGRWWRYREQAPYGVKNERIRAWIERELQSRQVSRAGSATLDVGYLREHDRLIRHVRQRLAQVRCPQVLALHAEEDEVASLKNLGLLARGLSSASICLKTVTVRNSYHMISIDNDRQLVVKETVDFVRSLLPAG